MGFALHHSDFYDLMEDQPDQEPFSAPEGFSHFFVTENLDASEQMRQSAPFVLVEGVASQGIEEVDFEDSSLAGKSKSVTINIEGWQLILAVIAVLAGPYIYTWNAFGNVSDSVDDLRKENAAAMMDLSKTIREEMKLSRQEATTQFELLRKDMNEDRRNSTNSLMDLQKQQGQLRPLPQ